MCFGNEVVNECDHLVTENAILECMKSDQNSSTFSTTVTRGKEERRINKSETQLDVGS